MLVLGLGGAAINFTTGNGMVVSLSGMSLAALVGVILNLLLPNEEDGEIKSDVKEIKNDINKLKDDIKNELTVEITEEVLKQVKKEHKIKIK